MAKTPSDAPGAAGASKGLLKKGAPWKERTKSVVVKMTPEERDTAQKILDESGFPDWREAFIEWLREQRGTGFVTEAQARFLEARRTTAAIAKKFGLRKLQFLILKYKSLGGKSDARNIEEVFGEMVSELLDKRSGQKGITLEDLIVFKQFAASWRVTKDLERDVLASAAEALKRKAKPTAPLSPEDKLGADS